MESLQVPNDISEWLELGQNVVERVGDCANLERKVNLRSVFWENDKVCQGWTLQKDRITKNARIIDAKVDIPFKMNTLFGNSEHPFPERQCIAFRSRVQLFFN